MNVSIELTPGLLEYLDLEKFEEEREKVSGELIEKVREDLGLF